MEAVLDRGSFCSVSSTAVLLGVFISHLRMGDLKMILTEEMFQLQ